MGKIKSCEEEMQEYETGSGQKLNLCLKDEENMLNKDLLSLLNI